MKTNQPISQEEFELLESYLMDRMKPAEKSRLETRLKHEAKLQENLAEVRTLINGLQEATLKEKLEKFHQELVSNIKPIPGKSRQSWWLVAASLIFLVGVLFWVNRAEDERGNQLFHAYFEQDPGLPSAMSGASTYVFDRGMVDFKTGDYVAALNQWRPLLDEKPTNDTLNYFMGMAHLGLGEASEGMLFLDRVQEDQVSFFREDALWYKALALIYLREYDSALSLLRGVNHPEKEELINKLKEK